MAASGHLLALLAHEGYDVLSELGHGQFGKVVLVKERASGTQIAVKVVAESFSSENERSMIGRPAHPNVLQIHKSIFDPTMDVNICFMEYCNGGDMQMWLDRSERPLDFRELVVFTTQVASGIQFLHSINVTHRDIKPSNILLNVDNGWTTYKLGDFGTVRDKEMMETLAGTPFFMAPEVEEGGYGKEVDLWSLGCMLFYCCTLRQLFNAKDRMELRDMVHRPLTPDVIRDRLLAEPRCKFSEVERERVSFAVSALAQLVPTQRMAIADLLQQIQPSVRVTDVRTGDCQPVPVGLALRPTVRNLAGQVAAVFDRAADNIHLLSKQGTLLDISVDAALWDSLELLMIDDEAYLGNVDAAASPATDDFEIIDDHESPDASHALACLPAAASRLKMLFASKLPELQATAGLRETVGRELTAATAALQSIRMAIELFHSISDIAEDDEQLAALVQTERHVSAVAAVVEDSGRFLTAGDSPIVALAKEFATLDFLQAPSEKQLPQALQRHFSAVCRRFESFSAALRGCLRDLLKHHAQLSALLAPHGELTRATRALQSYRTLMAGIVEQTAQVRSVRTAAAATDAAELARSRAETAAAMAQAADHAASLAHLQHTLQTVESALRKAQEALQAREQEVGLDTDLGHSFGSRLGSVLEEFYKRSEAQHQAAEAAAAVAAERKLKTLQDDLTRTVAQLAAARQSAQALETDLVDRQRNNESLRERVAVYDQQLQHAKSEATGLQRQVEELRAQTMDQEAELARGHSEQQAALSAVRAENDSLKHQVDASRENAQALQMQLQVTAAALHDCEAALGTRDAALGERDANVVRLTSRVDSAERAAAEARAAVDDAVAGATIEAKRALGDAESRAASLATTCAAAEEAAVQARQRIGQLENAMRESAAKMNELDQALRAKDQQLKLAQAEQAKLRESVSVARVGVPQFTPPSKPSPTRPGAELEALRADNTNLSATVRQLQQMLAALRQQVTEHARHTAEHDRRTAELAVVLEQAQAAAAEAARERDTERAHSEHLEQQLRDAEARIFDLQQQQQQREVEQREVAAPVPVANQGLDADERELLAGLQEENLRLDAARGDVEETSQLLRGQIDHMQREVQEALRARDQLTSDIVAQHDHMQRLADDNESLREHVRMLAEENTMLRRGPGGQDDLIAQVARFLFGNRPELRTTEDCAARLQAMLDRRGEVALIALRNFQWGDTVFALGESRVAQVVAPSLRLAEAGHVPAGTLLSVVLVEGEMMHAEARPE